MFIYPYFYRKLKRGPQVILPKDIGIIISYSSIDKSSVCVDAGTGSGWLALSLARLCRHVYSYDVREDFTAIAEKNKHILGLENITFKKGDVRKRIDEREVDLVTLDMPDADKAVSSAKKALRDNGMIVGYLPNMEQVQGFAKKLKKLGFSDMHTVEVTVREMLVREEGMRPSTKGIWHTAYLTFGRKENRKSAEVAQ